MTAPSGQTPTILLVGRPNVGKSTLFNKLTRTRAALVDDREGVTRDWIERPWRLPGGRTVNLRDLCGFRAHEEDPVLARSQAAMQGLWADATLILLVVDARVGITAADQWVADQLRQSGKPVLLVANKIDTAKQEPDGWATASMGWEPQLVSSEHGMGLYELEAAVADALEVLVDDVPLDAEEFELKAAILGRPNAGKSTLLNRLLGEDRATVSEVAGTTRDPVDAAGELAGMRTRFVDTAGLRRRRSIDDQLEAAAASRSLRAAEEADVVLYLIRADEGITQQDQILLGRVAELGKGILLLFSQWDTAAEPAEAIARLELERERMLPFLAYAPALTVSAVSGHNVGKIHEWTRRLVDQLDTEIPTRTLNRVLEELIARNPPPAIQLRRSRRSKQMKVLKIYYATQTGTRPLRLRLFVNLRGTPLPPPYHRYLEKRLREELGLSHIPIVLEVRGKPAEERSAR